MSRARSELVDLTNRFVDAFNRHDLDGIVSFFSEDAIYEDTSGRRHTGPDAIRAAFAPLVGGDMGEISFDEEDLFLDEDAGKVMTSWRLTMEVSGERKTMRGLDLLHFQDGKLVQKLAYAKAKAVQFET